jgi:hypothetical protein
MFGFGQSSQDKEIIVILERTLSAWGLPTKVSGGTVKQVVEATKREAKAQFGGNAHAIDVGDVFVKNTRFMEPCRAKGVRVCPGSSCCPA